MSRDYCIENDFAAQKELSALSEHKLEQQLQQARREGKAEGIRLGWEQCKQEVVSCLCSDCICNDTCDAHCYEVSEIITKLTYKEAQDES